MDFLLGMINFINLGTDELIVKSIKNKQGLVLKEVVVHGPYGPHIEKRWVDPNKDKEKPKSTVNKKPQKESMRARFTRVLMGFKTKVGTVVTGMDKDHFFRRVAERHVNLDDITDALKNPLKTFPGSNEKGSTVYQGALCTVVVLNDGIIKTCWIR